MTTLTSLVALINATRVVDDLAALRSFGATGGGQWGHGVSRRGLSEADVAARRWVAERFAAAGLRRVHLDGIGSVYGEGGDDGVPALLMGSHTDTQPEGGWLDGALGVAFAIEAARVLHAGNAPGAWAIADWQDEEGRFGTLTASSAFAAPRADSLPTVHSPHALDAARADAGLRERPILWHGTARAAGWRGYLEAHIEQGPMLERENATLGVVSSIVGLRQLVISCAGEQNHAGSTRMADRKDATLAAMRLAVALDDALRALCAAEESAVLGEESAAVSAAAHGCLAVWTFSNLEGFVSHSTVPGSANLTLQFRAPEEASLERMERAVRTLVRAAPGPVQCGVRLARESVRAMRMDEGLRACVAAAAEAAVDAEEGADGRVGERSRVRRMHSAAIHDAAPLADVMPAAMLFVPSVRGVSHSFDEHTHEADIRDGATAFVAAAARVVLGHPCAGPLAHEASAVGAPGRCDEH